MLRHEWDAVVLMGTSLVALLGASCGCVWVTAVGLGVSLVVVALGGRADPPYLRL
ncbi:hypothetical protein [Actinopolyspora halophila]|uniref:hypothetical protein n=1 Tax=Actinopolyspora halophila TaxID=1850 RepID=UPI00037548B8|nr:hypothetical protein [Actinopolyspora halophila]